MSESHCIKLRIMETFISMWGISRESSGCCYETINDYQGFWNNTSVGGATPHRNPNDTLQYNFFSFSWENHTISLWKYQEKPFHDRSKLKPRVFLMHVFHGFTSPPSHSCFLFCGQFSPLPLDLLCCLFPRSFILTFCLPAVSSGYLPGVLYSHGCPLSFALYFWDWEFAQCIYLLFVLWALWWLPTNFWY